MEKASHVTGPVADAYTFDPFARHPFYARINQALVCRAVGRLDVTWPTNQCVRVVDLAAGTGAVTQLILAELERVGRPATVTGIEPSVAALESARKQLSGPNVRFVQGDTDQLGQIAPEADAVFLCNALHLFPDKPAAVRQIRSVLGPGGVFACNSTFFLGAHTPESERFAHLWIRRALGWLREHHPDVRPSRRNQVAGLAWLSADEYAELLEAQGLVIVERTLEVVMMPIRAVQDIGRYQLFIEGALPGVPIPMGADALEWGAGEAARELDITEVPRVWLQLLAIVPGSVQ
jgi:ubiquinone/menaquinone biosynthesis C-methylase UbiE